jgi:hypothetical protein
MWLEPKEQHMKKHSRSHGGGFLRDAMIAVLRGAAGIIPIAKLL